MNGNLLYAQSGGVTAVINATAAAVIDTARKHKGRIGKVLAARNGVVGALREELIDTYAEDWRALATGLPADSVLVGLSSVHWREAWK